MKIATTSYSNQRNQTLVELYTVHRPSFFILLRDSRTATSLRPLTATMAPTTLAMLSKRSTCGTYTNPCTPDVHRTAILIILLAMGFLTISILLWYYVRKRNAVHPGPSQYRPGAVHPHKLQKRGARTWRREIEGGMGTELPRYQEREGEGEKPPSYGEVLARPEGVHMGSARRV